MSKIDKIEPRNLTAQFEYLGQGNPISSHPASSVANCFPGLELDFRNIWKHLFEGIELHEADNIVVSVDSNAPENIKALLFHELVKVEGREVSAPIKGPNLNITGGLWNFEWTNTLAEIVARDTVQCVFNPPPLRLSILEASGMYTPEDPTSRPASYPSTNLLDADPKTPWITPYRLPMQDEYVVINLMLPGQLKPREINCISLFPADLIKKEYLRFFPKSFRLEVSLDAKSWTKVVPPVENYKPKSGDWNRWDFGPTEARYIRLYITETGSEFESGPYCAMISDIKVDEVKQPSISVDLTVRPFFHIASGAKTTVISEQIAKPGSLTQSLCSPWQNDYRECQCFYWAASRPDFVNVKNGKGHNWLQRERSDTAPREYIRNLNNDQLLSYNELFQNWEKALKFIKGGNDSE